MDWNGWMDRWDKQQEGYIGNREERFDVLIDAVAHATGDEPRVLDLCCGPGSLSARLLERLPLATVVAVDADPTLQLLGQKVYGDAGGRLTWVNQDIADPEWERIIGRLGPFDAVASTTALHYLKASTLTAVYEVVWRLLRPGGVFVDGDHLFEAGSSPWMRSLHRTLRVRASDPPRGVRTVVGCVPGGGGQRRRARRRVRLPGDDRHRPPRDRGSGDPPVPRGSAAQCRLRRGRHGVAAGRRPCPRRARE